MAVQTRHQDLTIFSTGLIQYQYCKNYSGGTPATRFWPYFLLSEVLRSLFGPQPPPWPPSYTSSLFLSSLLSFLWPPLPLHLIKLSAQPVHARLLHLRLLHLVLSENPPLLPKEAAPAIEAITAKTCLPGSAMWPHFFQPLGGSTSPNSTSASLVGVRVSCTLSPLCDFIHHFFFPPAFPLGSNPSSPSQALMRPKTPIPRASHLAKSRILPHMSQRRLTLGVHGNLLSGAPRAHFRLSALPPSNNLNMISLCMSHMTIMNLVTGFAVHELSAASVS